MQAIAQLEEFVQFLADHQHRATGVAQGQDLGADLGGGADVDSPGGLRDHQQSGLGVDLAADDELLQVAARERTGRGIGATGAHVEAFDDVAGLLAQRAHADPAAAAHRLAAREHQVVGQAQRGHGTTT